MNERIEQFVWQHGDSEVRFREADLPLVIGTVSGAQIRLAGPGGQTLCQIDLIEGKPFVQPLLRPSPMQVDGQTLATTQTLSDGSRLDVFGVQISVGIRGDTLTLHQDSAASVFETLPPVAADTDDDDALIVATDWQPGADQPSTSQPRRWLAPVVVGALVVLLSAIWWLTSAVALRLETTPVQPDLVLVQGPGVSIPIGDRWLLRRGVHQITLRSDGYADLIRTVDVDGSQATLVLAQQPLPGSIVINADAEGASAELTAGDGSRFSAALPARFDGLLPGEYALAIRAADHLDWEDVVEVQGLAREQRIDVDLVADYAEVSIATEPAGASVFSLADNAPMAETTPATVRLAEGKHTLLFQLDGYQPVERTYQVYANTRENAELIKLEPADASLVLSSRPSGASVTMDGRYRGRTPLTLAMEPDRRYQLRLTRPGYASVTRQVSLAAAQTRSMDIDLSARLGEVTIRTIPTDAEILINGRVAGAGTVTTTLPAQPQRVTVRKRGFVTWQKTVTPRPGFTQTVDAKLVSNEAAKLAKIPQQLSVANDHTLRYVRGGTFRQGSSRREADRRSNEPLLDVRITRAFYMSDKEVTNRQFAAFRRNHDARGDVYPSLAGDSNPVINVSWQDAAAYCNWLSEKEQLEPAYAGEFGELVPAKGNPNGYRLPTEAEWVWVARYGGRDGERRRFGWGDDMPPPEKTANLADESSKEIVTNIVDAYRDGFPATAPVGSFDVNATGLHDLDGNVSEWLHDYYSASPAQSGPLIDPAGPARGPDHVIRGPSWRSANVSRLRLAYREFGVQARDDLGFRIVRGAAAQNVEGAQDE